MYRSISAQNLPTYISKKSRDLVFDKQLTELRVDFIFQKRSFTSVLCFIMILQHIFLKLCDKITKERDERNVNKRKQKWYLFRLFCV